MLEQALSGSQHGDVRFVLEDGSSPLSGYRAVLGAGSQGFARMFRSGSGGGQECKTLDSNSTWGFLNKNQESKKGSLENKEKTGE
jgi:hypothetical protein